MMKMNYTFNGKEVENRTQAALWEGLQRAVTYYREKIVEALGVTAKAGKGTKAKDFEASRPGEPPRKRTGWLQRHIHKEFDKKAMKGAVGVNVNAIYGLYLELGTSRMAARPFLLRTLKKFWAQIKAQWQITK